MMGMRAHGVMPDVPECLARLHYSAEVVAEANRSVSQNVVAPPPITKPPEVDLGPGPGRKTQLAGGMLAAGGGTLLLVSGPIAAIEDFGGGFTPAANTTAAIGGVVVVCGLVTLLAGTSMRNDASLALRVSPQGVLVSGSWR